MGWDSYAIADLQRGQIPTMNGLIDGVAPNAQKLRGLSGGHRRGQLFIPYWLLSPQTQD
jgi:hypothetical protein